MKAFLRTAEDQWGTRLARVQLVDVALIDTPHPEPYLDNKQTDKTFHALKEEVTSKARDEYMQSSIMIPSGNIFACRTVVSCKNDVEGNIIGGTHDNPILDSCYMAMNLQTVKSLSLLQMQLPKLCIHSVTLMEMSMSSWTNTLMLSALMMSLPLTSSRSYHLSIKVYKWLVHLLPLERCLHLLGKAV